MKYLILFLFVLSGCGYSARNIEAIGQVKRVSDETPLICPDWNELDLSLGFMRNGVGSISNHDMFLTVSSKEQLNLLKKAAEQGNLVKITYDEKRVTFCINSSIVTSVEIIK